MSKRVMVEPRTSSSVRLEYARQLKQYHQQLSEHLDDPSISNRQRVQCQGLMDYTMSLMRQIQATKVITREINQSINLLDRMVTHALESDGKMPDEVVGGSLWDLAGPIYTITRAIKDKFKGSGMTKEQIGGFLPLLGFAEMFVKSMKKQ